MVIENRGAIAKHIKKLGLKEVREDDMAVLEASIDDAKKNNGRRPRQV